MNDTTAVSASSSKADRTIFELLHAAHSLENRVDEALSRAGLSMPKFAVLSELVSAGKPVSLSELAMRLSCVKSNMTQLIDRLETDGLVRRVDDPTDRRAVMAAITASGEVRFQAGDAEMARLHADFSAALDSADRDALHRALSALE